MRYHYQIDSWGQRQGEFNLCARVWGQILSCIQKLVSLLAGDWLSDPGT